MVTTGAAGFTILTSIVDDETDVHEPFVAVTKYVPDTVGVKPVLPETMEPTIPEPFDI